MALFEAIHIHKRFGSRVVLEDISLSFEEGQVSGIMGPNGAGKTTCFNVLTGRYAPDRGEIRLKGQSIAGLAPQRIARLGVSRSFQIMSLFDDYTVIENVMIALPEVRAQRQAMLAQIDHLERYGRTRGWLRGPLTSEFRRRGRDEDRRALG